LDALLYHVSGDRYCCPIHHRIEAVMATSQWRSKRSGYQTDMRELLIAMMDKYPTADRKELFRLFVERARVDDEYLIVAVDHAVNKTLNAMESLKRQAGSMGPDVRQQAERESASMVETIKDQIMNRPASRQRF
jgi:hypothetical protein